LRHLVADGDVDLLQQAGDLGADIDVFQRLQIAQRRDRILDVLDRHQRGRQRRARIGARAPELPAGDAERGGHGNEDEEKFAGTRHEGHVIRRGVALRLHEPAPVSLRQTAAGSILTTYCINS
jgi:hypothetical protein